jgi:hypothetical protein
MQFDTRCWWLIVGPRSRMSLAPINCKSMSKRVVSNASIARASSALLTQTQKVLTQHIHPNEQSFRRLTFAKLLRLQHPFYYCQFGSTARILSIYYNSATVPQQSIEVIQDNTSRSKTIWRLCTGKVLKQFALLTLSRPIGTGFPRCIHLRASGARFHLLQVHASELD